MSHAVSYLFNNQFKGRDLPQSYKHALSLTHRRRRRQLSERRWTFYILENHDFTNSRNVTLILLLLYRFDQVAPHNRTQ